MWYENWGLNNHKSGVSDPAAGSQKALECKSLIKQGLKPKAERRSLQKKTSFTELFNLKEKSRKPKFSFVISIFPWKTVMEQESNSKVEGGSKYASKVWVAQLSFSTLKKNPGKKKKSFHIQIALSLH